MSRAKRYAIQGTDHISLQGSPLSPWNSAQQQSLHDIRTANAIRVGPGSYRVLAPKIPSSVTTAVSRILKPTSSSEVSQHSLQESGSSLAADIACFKAATLSEKRTPRKRVYFPDLPAEDLTSKKTVRIVKGDNEKYHGATSMSVDKSLPDSKSNETIVVDGEEQSEILLEPAIDVEGYEEEVTVTEEYEDESGALTDPYLVLESRDVISGSSLRELKGENSYLKEQLHASVLRVKQLEALLLERNTHVKNLVSENLQLSIKCRKLMNALGEEETREALE